MSMFVALFAVAAAAQSQPTTVAKSDDDPIVCKQSKQPEVGTRFKPKPICRRKSQWDLETQLEKQARQEARDRHTGYPSPEGR
jgi:hypothetical protein